MRSWRASRGVGGLGWSRILRRGALGSRLMRSVFSHHMHCVQGRWSDMARNFRTRTRLWASLNHCSASMPGSTPTISNTRTGRQSTSALSGMSSIGKQPKRDLLERELVWSIGQPLALAVSNMYTRTSAEDLP